MSLPKPIQNLIDSLSRLPGIGPKTASRLTFFLLRAPEDLSFDLADALQTLKSGTRFCSTCFNITDAGRDECEICTGAERDAALLCIVEDPLDVLALERTGGYRGRYHVLHGALSPIEGIGPEDLKIAELLGRVKAEDIREIILATNPSLEEMRLPCIYASVWNHMVSRLPGWHAAFRWAETLNTQIKTHCCGPWRGVKKWIEH
jgi:recombination protein RecR